MATKLAPTKGIMSLSRAFFYAGCKSVVTSLWKAEDVSIAFIIKQMHQYLMNGFVKDEALQKAKADYLKSDDIDPAFKTPAYWATLVLTGDYHSIVSKSHFPLYLVLIFGATIFFLLIRKYFWKPKSLKHYNNLKATL